MDGGELELNRVFELISEGERLRVSCLEELKVITAIVLCLNALYFVSYYQESSCNLGRVQN